MRIVLIALAVFSLLLFSCSKTYPPGSGDTCWVCKASNHPDTTICTDYGIYPIVPADYTCERK